MEVATIVLFAVGGAIHLLGFMITIREIFAENRGLGYLSLGFIIFPILGPGTLVILLIPLLWAGIGQILALEHEADLADACHNRERRLPDQGKPDDDQSEHDGEI